MTISADPIVLGAVRPSAAALLEAWEKARIGGLAARVACLLRLVRPHEDEAALLEVPIGQRNRSLLVLHVVLAGPEVQCVVRCSHCQELNELSLQAAALMVPPGITPPGGFQADAGPWTLRFRLPNTADLVIGMGGGDLPSMRRIVAERCLLAIEPAPEGPLPEALIDALSLAIGRADPAAELLFHIQCVACGEQFVTLLDPSHLVWRELDDTSQRLLLEVDALARVYHWPEREILALSAERRQAYLSLVGA
jgi:hypothetical protein